MPDERRRQVLQATVEVLAEHGVAGTTHRRIAARAGVPLAFLTYHFAGLADLRAEAFAYFTEVQNLLYARLFSDVSSREEFIDALVEVVHRDREGTGHHSATVGFELYLAALRDPELRDVTAAWTAASRAVLARFTDPATADFLDGLLEGLILKQLLAPGGIAMDRTRQAIERILGSDGPPLADPGRQQ